MLSSRLSFCGSGAPRKPVSYTHLYAAACLLAAYEKDKAGAAALLTDFRAVRCV